MKIMKTSSTISLRGETDFLRRQNNRQLKQQKKRRSIQVRGIHLAVLLLLLSSIAFGIYKTGRFVLNWEKLNVKNFRLTNCPPSKLPDVKRILGLNGGNILALGLEDLRAQLLAVPEVKDVFISRVLPSTVEVTFLLRQPVFQLETKGKYNIIDKEGVHLYKNVEKRTDLITAKNVAKGQEEALIPYFEELSEIKDFIEYVSLKPPYGIQLKLKGVRETFYPGDIDFASKINYYLKLRKKLFLDKNKITNVDLRFEDRFYLEYEEEVHRKNEE